MNWTVRQTTELNHHGCDDVIWLITDGTKTFSSFYEDWAIWLCNELNGNRKRPFKEIW